MEVAIKINNRPWKELSKMEQEEFVSEIERYGMLANHENVVRIFGWFTDPEKGFGVVMELCEQGSILDYLHGARKNGIAIQPLKKLEMVMQAATGLVFLHDNKIVHRDIAARNILVTKSGDVRISDFGMSRKAREGAEGAHITTTNTGPLKWMAPEQIKEASSTFKSDVWSFGVFVWELFTEKEPFPNLPAMQAAIKVLNEHWTVGTSDPSLEDFPALRDLLQSCWQRDPEDRPNFDQIIKRIEEVVEPEMIKKCGALPPKFVDSSSLYQSQKYSTSQKGQSAARYQISRKEIVHTAARNYYIMSS
eukprot:TRINITY_DN561_c0_g1_i1.p1 TRINITY_DN561_c0_g1~~TRINITY_DN561_c0_g1_i1.p1  ORF type:complete len:306 (-),score=42.25 TRINITY_DN561_c0_g1_i1:488-1405(-)